MECKFLKSTVIGRHSKPVHTIASSSGLEREYLVTGSVDRKVRFLDSKTGEELVQRTGHTRSVMSVAISDMGPNGEDPLICSGGREGCLIMWDTSAKFSGHIAKVPIEEIRCIAVYQGSESFVLVGSKEGKLVLWDLNNDTVVADFEGSKGCIHCVAIHSFVSDPDTQNDLDCLCIASGGADRSVRLWDIKNPTNRKKKLKHPRSVGCIAIACKGIRPVLASGTSDNCITLWDVQSGLQLQLLEGHKGPVNQIKFWEGYEILLISASADRTLRVFDALTGESVCTLIGHTDDVLDLAITTDGIPDIVSCGIDNTLRFWDLEGLINIFYRSEDGVPGQRNSTPGYNPPIDYTPPKTKEEALALHQKRKDARRAQRRQLRQERKLREMMEEEERAKALMDGGLAHSSSAQRLQLALSSRNRRGFDYASDEGSDDEEEDDDLEMHFQKVNQKKTTAGEARRQSVMEEPKSTVLERRKSLKESEGKEPMALEDQVKALLNDNFEFDDFDDDEGGGGEGGEAGEEEEEDEFDGELMNQMMALRAPENPVEVTEDREEPDRPPEGLARLSSFFGGSAGRVHPNSSPSGISPEAEKTKKRGMFGVLAATGRMLKSLRRGVSVQPGPASEVPEPPATALAVAPSSEGPSGHHATPKRPAPLKRRDSNFRRADEIQSEFTKAEAMKSEQVNKQKSKAKDRLAERLRKKQGKGGEDMEDSSPRDKEEEEKEKAALQALKQEKLLQHKLQEERRRKAMQEAQNRSVQALQKRLEEIAAKRALQQLPAEDDEKSDDEDNKKSGAASNKKASTPAAPERDVFFISDDEDEDD